jgi:predicted transcriptional regulator
MPAKPTDAELAMLSVLWRRGPSTVREVMDELSAEKPTGYTTVLKIMQIMVEKGLVKRDESRRTHVYRPAVPAERTQKHLVKELVNRAFQGSARKLVMQALSERSVSREELDEIRALLDELEEGKS